MKTEYTKIEQTTSHNENWKRDEVVGNVIDFEEAKDKQSQRQFALGACRT